MIYMAHDGHNWGSCNMVFSVVFFFFGGVFSGTGSVLPSSTSRVLRRRQPRERYRTHGNTRQNHLQVNIHPLPHNTWIQYTVRKVELPRESLPKTALQAFPCRRKSCHRRQCYTKGRLTPRSPQQAQTTLQSWCRK